ncbi:MAG TPA: energy transducer TonB [Edaphobacter sp.]|nr:energy transducer TonB [Edaphobacter sp.]
MRCTSETNALSLLAVCLCHSLVAFSQSGPSASPEKSARIIVAAPDKQSGDIITIPPETSWAGSIRNGKQSVNPNSAGDFEKWLQHQSAQNGLQSQDTKPWHIIINYDQFDEDGDNIHSGVIEEFWAGPKKFKIRYASDTLNQTDYGTDRGLFRLGDQRWQNRAEIQALNEVISPFFYVTSLQNFQMQVMSRTFGTYTLECTVFQRNGVISASTQYCFDKNDTAALRYTRGEGWYQTVYNNLTSIDGHNMGRDVDVTDGGHPYLKLRIETLELLTQIEEKDFTPPVEATNLMGKRVSGVSAKPVQTAFPEWPTSLQQQHFVVTVGIVIGKDGRVTEAHAISGPPEAYKAAEKTAKKWMFKPYLILGESVEVESKIQLSNN